MPVRHMRVQYAVGQGGFHGANVEHETADSKEPFRFDYVYDCGALAGRTPSKALLRAVEDYEPRREGDRTVLDALVLSHYDYDHINGAKQLADGHEVRRIFVPYLSPPQLLAEIARSALQANGVALEALFAGAHGGSLWGSKVVPVRGARGGVREDRALPEEPRSPERIRRPDVPPGQGPGVLVPLLETTGGVIPEILEDVDPLGLYSGDGSAVWRLKFWNYQQDAFVEDASAELLEESGFPLAAVTQVDGARKVLEWLQQKSNRVAANEAYREALFHYTGKWFPKKDLPNLSSLALYSGPYSKSVERAIYSIDSHRWSPFVFRFLRRQGWLGTGDAPLGEAPVWQAFSRHFRFELPEVRTVLVPHHGAAPPSGLAFYNADLNSAPGTVTVISVGAENPYGHPRPSVLSEVTSRSGFLHVLTEDSEPLVERSLLLGM